MDIIKDIFNLIDPVGWFWLLIVIPVGSYFLYEIYNNKE